MHNCPDCGLAHDEPSKPGEDPLVKVAKIEADRDVEVAKIAAGVSRDEMMREIDALRAELTVRQEEPPVAETTVTETIVEADPEPEPVPELAEADPEPEPEEIPPPPETEPARAEKSRGGFWGNNYG